MRWWVFSFCILLICCGTEVQEKTVTSSQSEAKDSQYIPNQTMPADTGANFAKDIVSSNTVSTQPVKSPSGIWQFLFDYDADTRILQTVSFSPTTYILQEEYLGSKDSVVITEGTWAPSQGFIWLYDRHLVRGRYIWKGDSLQYFSPRLNKRFSMTKLTPASVNPVWQAKKKEGAVLYGVGTEPFWSIEIKNQDSIIMSMPSWTEPLRLKSSGITTNNNTIVYSASSDSLQVQVHPYLCSDGMSDFTYSHKVTVHYKGQTYRGCGMLFR